MADKYICRAGSGVKTHRIRGGEWKYNSTNHTVCGRVATAVESLMSGNPLEVTCQKCKKGKKK